ncbi:MAG: ABC transporter ATP-binding protein [Deltaproteobacteria bacterium]|jgi:NitT/TauT family transport system ATP-binding protein|nr:ABC transporter ATP-binding protein [Deltaproteobacteria bacterium]
MKNQEAIDDPQKGLKFSNEAIPVDDGSFSPSTKPPNPGGGIEFINVGHIYGNHKRGSTNTEAVAEFSVSIKPGSLVCLLGPSGCGKSTLLNILAGFEKPSLGQVLVGGKKVSGPGPDRGVVFQEPNLLPWRKVIANITLGPDLAGRPKKETLAKARRFIELTGLSGFETYAPYELSGGMKQRVALARAWISEPPIMVMDEPFGALDAQTRISMQELLVDVWEKTGSTIVFVTHDVDEALFLADRILVMTPRPGRLSKDIISPLARPRIYESLVVNSDYAMMKREILLAMRKPEYYI